ncbi:hypothetical protein GCM10009844_24970 [Nocardioides koreensis]|uniref:Uncharacterized protein n=1 Tax=Nocardioides koreensis TaxID=433651 RepID=A0ABN2ZUN1_9ACTN
MLLIALVMLAIVVLAVLVVTFAAFPHRGEEVPAAPWLGEAMTKAADALPTIENVDGTASEETPRRGAERPAAARKDTGPVF